MSEQIPIWLAIILAVFLSGATIFLVAFAMVIWKSK